MTFKAIACSHTNTRLSIAKLLPIISNFIAYRCCFVLP